MRRRPLYHDEDYANDYTNPPSDRSRWHREKAARAKTCPGFEASEIFSDHCKHCYAPLTAHTEPAKKAS